MVGIGGRRHRRCRSGSGCYDRNGYSAPHSRPRVGAGGSQRCRLWYRTTGGHLQRRRPERPRDAHPLDRMGPSCDNRTRPQRDLPTTRRLLHQTRHDSATRLRHRPVHPTRAAGVSRTFRSGAVTARRSGRAVVRLERPWHHLLIARLETNPLRRRRAVFGLLLLRFAVRRCRLSPATPRRRTLHRRGQIRRGTPFG